ncbi:MAG: DUF6236 family protein [Planctomycetes bacterium]|nr:DUF6236 family protein [Planctomycetota bacterium]
MSRTVLYYPYIAVPTSGPWIRRALLYWDKIGAIVPRSYDSVMDDRGVRRYHPQIEELRTAGIFQAVNPGDLMIRGDPRGLIEDVKQILVGSRPPSSRPARCIVPIYRDKTCEAIITLLLKAGLAVEDRDRPLVYLFEAKTAKGYMALLAKHMAAGIGAVPATDEEPLNDVAFGRNSSGNLEPILSSRLSEVIPVPDSSVPLGKILAFREKYKSELLSFRAAMDEFEAKLAGARDDGEIKRVTQSFTERSRRETADLGKALSASRISTFLGSLQAFIKPNSPTLIGSAAVIAGQATSLTTLSMPWVIGGVVTAGLIEVGVHWFGKVQERRKALESTPFAYLFLAKKRLARK